MITAFRLFILFGLAVLAAGCQSIGNKDAYGPSPVIDADDARVSADNQLNALTAFANAARLPLPEAGSPDWFAVTEAGFNYVDEKCDAYITELFIANRTKDKLKGFAVLADKASNAILLASGASKTAMAIVAQSFGFAEGATDLVANSYLYQIEPSRIQLIVHSLRLAYRQGLYARRKTIRYPTLAHHHIQKYLELCLPQTIEARINDVLGRTTALPDLTTLPGTFDVLLVTTPQLPQNTVAESQPVATAAAPPPVVIPSPPILRQRPRPRARAPLAFVCSPPSPLLATPGDCKAINADFGAIKSAPTRAAAVSICRDILAHSNKQGVTDLCAVDE